MARTKLEDAEVDKRIASFPGWTRDGNALVKEWRFKDYAHAVLLVNAVAHVAEALDHHPDVLLGYGYVRVTITTHDTGGITGTDFEFVEAVEALPASRHLKSA